MDTLIASAAEALATGDALAALKCVALRDDAPALALRGIAMAQLGELARARELLRAAARAFGPGAPLARARCVLADAEIALILRDLGRPLEVLGPTRESLARLGDRHNAAHAGYLDARRLLLIGRLVDAEQLLETLDIDALPAVSRPGYWLVAAGIAMRRIRSEPARAALRRAAQAAEAVGLPALKAEVEKAVQAFGAPAARLISDRQEKPLRLPDVEALFASDILLADACRNVVRRGNIAIPLAGRPVLFALVRALAEAWPDDVPRESLLAQAFGAREADLSHRARLRVEIGRLRELLKPLAGLGATERGFILLPHGSGPAAVLAPPAENAHADLLALLADGEAWSSSALALALDVSPRTVQRGLERLLAAGKVDRIGRGRTCRWLVARVPGFPTSLLLPGPGISG